VKRESLSGEFLVMLKSTVVTAIPAIATVGSSIQPLCVNAQAGIS